MKSYSVVVLSGALLVNSMAVERATIEECRVVDIKIATLLEENPPTGDEFCSSYLSLEPSPSTTDIVFDSTIFVTRTSTRTVCTITVTAAVVTTTEARYGYGAYGALATTSSSTTSVPTTTLSPTPTTSISSVESLAAALADSFPADISLGCDCQLNPPGETTAITIFDHFTTSTIRLITAEFATVTVGEQTVTQTATSVIVDEACPTPAFCGNAGVEWAQYHNDQGYNWSPSYSQFDPAVYKTTTPNATGTTSRINVDSIFANTGDTFPVPVYDIEVPVELFVLNHRGYFYAPTAGVYTFYMPQVDDAGFVWHGDKAYSGWDRTNADISFIVSLPVDQQKTSFSVRLAAGQYLPIRIVFAQAQGGVRLQLQVIGPDGNQYCLPFLYAHTTVLATAPRSDQRRAQSRRLHLGKAHLGRIVCHVRKVRGSRADDGPGAGGAVEVLEAPARGRGHADVGAGGLVGEEDHARAVERHGRVVVPRQHELARLGRRLGRVGGPVVRR
ncbi:hypothetical protein G7054_g15176 [Neopestalotiopsis clavispora]|nr:hypothetical protein G7054_g15176 [Neopestalotiopsis clavispora]